MPTQSHSDEIATVYRVENEDMVDLGEYPQEQARKVAKRLSLDSATREEFVVDYGDRAESYRDGECRGQMLSSTRRSA